MFKPHAVFTRDELPQLKAIAGGVRHIMCAACFKHVANIDELDSTESLDVDDRGRVICDGCVKMEKTEI